MKAQLSLALVLTSLLMNGLSAQTRDFHTVTESMLRDPPPGDWLNWRRTDNAWGYSPLDRINRTNVGQLQLAWSWAMEDTGAQEAAPLVHDGVMYLPNPRGVVQALDAATGELIWEYRPGAAPPEPRADNPRGERSAIPRLPQAPTPVAGSGRGIQKNIAIYGDKIFSATDDAHIVALDARTGRVVWDVAVADSSLGYQYTAGPIVVRGKLITGISGCSRYKDDVCFITGHDAETGKELWRTSTIARPGEPGGDTWGDLPLRFRAGSEAWIAGSYDPQTNLVYWGTAQAKPWARVARGTDGDALYTNSTLALDPDTGRMVWYYQHLPGETQDMDEVFENILIDVGGRKSLFKMGKLGILWRLDRESGEFISARDLGYQNIVDVHPESGAVTYRPGKIPQIGVEVDMCPSTAGLKSWRAMAFSPETNALYVPLNLNCEVAVFGPAEQVLGGGGAGPVRRRDYKHPDSAGNLGEFLALDIVTGEVLWRYRTPSPMNTAALTTGGGLVFAGEWDRYTYAYDVATGEVLWRTRLPTSAQGFPVTYLAQGKQFVAIPAGIGGGSWSTLIPPELAPELRRPNNGNAIYVFALPEQLSAASGPATRAPTRNKAAVAIPAPLDEGVETSAESVWQGVYTVEQAQRGRETYATACVACHGPDLRGDSNTPSLVEESFRFLWGGRTLGELLARTQNLMPPLAPNSLTPQGYRDILAFLLQANGFPAGPQEMPADPIALRRIRLAFEPAEASPGR